MIDTVVLIMAGAVSGRSLRFVQSDFMTHSNFMREQELSQNFHPLGLFDSIENLLVASDLK